jgi:hypothetical protein
VEPGNNREFFSATSKTISFINSLKLISWQEAGNLPRPKRELIQRNREFTGTGPEAAAVSAAWPTVVVYASLTPSFG